ncbi:MAG TPA: YraN family protein [Patescibacteria group bacterium]|jgi:putative endonuclease|nr:YraN family protein [Patescibacteria group bacterium]
MKKSTTSHRLFGNWAEQYVAVHLMKSGFTILHKNYRKTFGEIDIIAYQRNLLIFVEVKARKTKTVNPEEIIVKSKQKKIIATAKDFLMYFHEYDRVTARFDVALIEGNEQQATMSYIENAFQPDE